MHHMVWYYPENHEKHFEYGHPERPERVEVMVKALSDLGWWELYPHLDPESIDNSIIEAVHSPSYLKHLKEACDRGRRLNMDTYTTPSSWQLSMNTAGGAVAVAKSVWHREANRGFALTRPPGHHATANQGMGFCLFNNVAISVEHLLQVEGAIRLAIVDLDLHHGNGTQDIFWRRDDVFYFSTHQYPHYPGTGHLRDVGAGRGKGTTANFPMPPGSGDQAFSEVMSRVIIPLLDKFKAEMIFVSYGFDTHWMDPLGQLTLSADGYRHIISLLTKWADVHCGGRIALFLEGGYNLDAGAACVQGVTAALLGQEWQDPLGSSPGKESESWQQMLGQAHTMWGL